MNNLPKYTICKRTADSMYGVYGRKGKLIEAFVDKSEAEKYVERLVEDDAWNAANR